MANEQTNTMVLSSMVHEKHEEWCKRKHYLYDKIIDMAGLSDTKLTDCMEENLEYAMTLILKHGTYSENAKALRMYAQYFNLYDLLEF